MAEIKPEPLNAACYSPPPLHQPYCGHDRERGCCSSPTSRFFKSIFATIFTTIIALGIAALVLCRVYRPSKMEVYVASAELSQFNLAGNTLSYSLSLNVSIRNPNKMIGIYYDELKANASYEGERFDLSFLPTFYQGHKNTTNVFPVFTGHSDFPNGDVAEFNKQKEEGLFSIDVNIYAWIRFKVGRVKMRRWNPKFECKLKLPVPTNGHSIGSSSAKCDVDF